MKGGSGIKGRDDRSSGIEILIADALAKINPTDPLILAKQAAWRNLNCSDSSGISLARAEDSRWTCRNSRRLKSDQPCLPTVSTVTGMKAMEGFDVLFFSLWRSLWKRMLMNWKKFIRKSVIAYWTGVCSEYHLSTKRHTVTSHRKWGRVSSKKSFLFKFLHNPSINLNLDGVPITSKSHTHPSYSQTSRPWTSSLSLGVPVPRPTQCMWAV